MAPPLKFTDEQIAEKLVTLQRENPQHSLVQLCARAEFSRATLYRRAKGSDAIQDSLKKTADIREAAWVDVGLANLDNKQFNTTLFIWMSKNIIGWRDQPEPQDDGDEAYEAP